METTKKKMLVFSYVNIEDELSEKAVELGRSLSNSPQWGEEAPLFTNSGDKKYREQILQFRTDPVLIQVFEKLDREFTKHKTADVYIVDIVCGTSFAWELTSSCDDFGQWVHEVIAFESEFYQL